MVRTWYANDSKSRNGKPSALLAVVFSACKKELAKNVCRQDTQNVTGHKEFIRGMGQGIGGCVRKAERGPNLYDL